MYIGGNLLSLLCSLVSTCNLYWALCPCNSSTVRPSLLIRCRSLKKKVGDNTSSTKEVIGMMESGGTYSLAEFHGTGWSLLGARWSLVFKETLKADSHSCELNGDRMVENSETFLFVASIDTILSYITDIVLQNV